MQALPIKAIVSFLFQARMLCLVVVAASVALPFSRPINGTAIISALCFSFFIWIAGFFKEVPRARVVWSLAVWQVCLFGLYAAGMLWVSVPDFEPHLDIRLGLIAFPAMLFFSPFREEDRDAVLFWFTVSVTMLGLVLFAIATRMYGTHPESYFFAGESLVYPVDLHRVYLALHALAALVFVTACGAKWASAFWKRLWQIFLIGFIILLSSRNVTLILVLLTVIYTGNLAIKRSRLEALVVLAALAVMLFGASFVPYVREIFVSLVHDYSQPANPSQVTSTSGWQVRHFIWQAGGQALESMPLYGYGTGTARYVLSTYYQHMHFNYGAAQLLNAHNQYLETLLDIGYPGLFVLVVLLLIGLVSGVRYNTPLALFFGICSLAFLTESYLEAQKGIVFITLFWTLLGSVPRPETVSSAPSAS